MKKFINAVCCTALILGLASCSSEKKEKEQPKTAQDAGTGATAQSANNPEQYTDYEEPEIYEEYGSAVPELSPAITASADENIKAGKEFLENRRSNDPAVKVTASGLGYKKIKGGNGQRPSASNMVSVKYTGRHIDGSEFDSSGNNTIDFPLSGVIAGFSEGLQLMDKGSVYELYIPGDLGYGSNGIPGVIGRSEMLIFEIELVDFR